VPPTTVPTAPPTGPAALFRSTHLRGSLVCALPGATHDTLRAGADRQGHGDQHSRDKPSILHVRLPIVSMQQPINRAHPVIAAVAKCFALLSTGSEARPTGRPDTQQKCNLVRCPLSQGAVVSIRQQSKSNRCSCRILGALLASTIALNGYALLLKLYGVANLDERTAAQRRTPDVPISTPTPPPRRTQVSEPARR
jgi:hypothetical protein